MIGKVLQDDELVPDRLGRLYYQTAAFTRLSDAIRQTYRSILECFREEYGERPVARLEEQHIAAILDKKADPPAAANHLRLLLRALMKLARKRKLITVNPMIEIEPIRYKVKGFKAWSDGEIKLFTDRYRSARTSAWRWSSCSAPPRAAAMWCGSGHRTYPADGCASRYAQGSGTLYQGSEPGAAREQCHGSSTDGAEAGC